MRRIGVAGGICVTLGMVAVVSAASPSGAAPHRVPTDEIVVKLSDSHVDPGPLLDALPGTTPRLLAGNRYELRVASGEAPLVLSKLNGAKGVQFAEVTGQVHMAATPNDPCYVSGCLAEDHPGYPNPEQLLPPKYLLAQTNQDDLNTVNATGAWAQTTGSQGVLVAVLDTGVDALHPDLAPNNVIAGPNICAADDPLCSGSGVSATDTDNEGHGTHVMGIVAAATGNGKGVASLGWNTHAESFKVLNSQGDGTLADLATGIYEATNAGARVINMSLSNNPCPYAGCGPDADTAAAVAYAQAHNVVVVAAAGNGVNDQGAGLSGPTYPASYPGVLAVAATNNAGAVAGFSEWGSAANIAAPGVNIPSTWIPQTAGTNQATYATEDGTSASTPMVSAAAALVIARNPSLSGPQVASVLESTARPTTGGNPINGGLLDAGAAVTAAAAGTPAVDGYRMAGSDGSVYAFGMDPWFGDLFGKKLFQPVVGIAGMPSGLGYWLDATDGGVFSFGAASFFGSTGGQRLNKPIVGMAATADGRGYWLVAADGGIFAYGDAHFYGSMGGHPLNQPVVGMAATPDGGGYWLVAADGGIFTFGDARFRGSTGSFRLNKPVVAMSADSAPGSSGYWLVASDGGIFAYGSARFFGSTGSLRLNKPIVGMVSSSNGSGYLLTASDGGIFAFGSVRFHGSQGGQSIPAPVVGVST